MNFACFEQKTYIIKLFYRSEPGILLDSGQNHETT